MAVVLFATGAALAQPPSAAGKTLNAEMDDAPAGVSPAAVAQARFEAALQLLRGGREREAVAALLAIGREFPEDDVAPEALFEAAQISEEQLKDPEAARRLYGELKDRYPRSRLLRRAQNRFDDLSMGLRSGPAALVEFNDISATFRTAGLPRTVERLQRLLREHADFAFKDRALYLLGTALRDSGKWDQAEATLAGLFTTLPQSPFAPRAKQALAEILVMRGDYGRARALFAELAAYGGPLWTEAAGEGLRIVEVRGRRRLLQRASAALLSLFLLAALVRGRRRLWPPPFEVYYYVPVAAFLVLVGLLAGGGGMSGAALALCGIGTVLVWLGGAAARADAERGRRTPLAGARRAAALCLGTLLRGLAVAAACYLVLYHGGLIDVILETLRSGPEG